MFRANQKTLVLTTVVDYLRENVANYFSYIARSNLQDYILEANFVSRQMSLDKGKVTIKKLAAIDVVTATIANGIKVRSETVVGVSDEINLKVINLSSRIYTQCTAKQGFSMDHLQSLLKENADEFLKLARDILYTKLEPIFVLAATEITQLGNQAHQFATPRSNM